MTPGVLVDRGDDGLPDHGHPRVVQRASVLPGGATGQGQCGGSGSLALAHVETLDGGSLGFEPGTQSSETRPRVITYYLRITPDDPTSTVGWDTMAATFASGN